MFASAMMSMAQGNYDEKRAETLQRLAVKVAPVAWEIIKSRADEIPTKNAARVALLAVAMAEEIILQSEKAVKT